MPAVTSAFASSFCCCAACIEFNIICRFAASVACCAAWSALLSIGALAS